MDMDHEKQIQQMIKAADAKKSRLGFYAGTAEISVTHNFAVRWLVRKTIVERTVK